MTCMTLYSLPPIGKELCSCNTRLLAYCCILIWILCGVRVQNLLFLKLAFYTYLQNIHGTIKVSYDNDDYSHDDKFLFLCSPGE